MAELQIRPITGGEYHAMGRAGVFAPDERVELLDGLLIAAPPIGPDHAYSVRRLTELFTARFRERAIVDVQLPLELSRISEPQPDLMLLRYRDDFYAGRLPECADVLLVVEVAVTSLPFDRGRKLRAYARAGIEELWIVDLVEQRLLAHRAPQGERYAEMRALGRGDRLAPLAFPQDAVDVSVALPPRAS